MHSAILRLQELTTLFIALLAQICLILAEISVRFFLASTADFANSHDLEFIEIKETRAVQAQGHLEKLLSIPIACGPGVNANESKRERSGIICRQFRDVG
jgi:hypothetical protein